MLGELSQRGILGCIATSPMLQIPTVEMVNNELSHRQGQIERGGPADGLQLRDDVLDHLRRRRIGARER
jgi:hypothetical protein